MPLEEFFSFIIIFFFGEQVARIVRPTAKKERPDSIVLSIEVSNYCQKKKRKRNQEGEVVAGTANHRKFETLRSVRHLSLEEGV